MEVVAEFSRAFIVAIGRAIASPLLEYERHKGYKIAAQNGQARR